MASKGAATKGPGDLKATTVGVSRGSRQDGVLQRLARGTIRLAVPREITSERRVADAMSGPAQSVRTQAHAP